MVNANLTNITTFPQLIMGIDGLTNGYLFLGIFIVIYIAIFAAFKVYDSNTAFIGSSFIMSIVGLFLVVSGINNNVLFIWVPIIGLIFGILLHYFNK